MPPSWCSATYVKVENEAYECPDAEIETSGWRDPAQTSKQDWEIYFAPDASIGSVTTN